MKRLHIFVLRSYIGPLILTFFISLFLLLMQFLWKYIDDLVGKGLEFKIIAELLTYTSASLVPMALPLAILLASLMTFGNLGENYELLALKSAGISLQRIMFPVIVLVIFLSIGAFYFANNVLPYSNLKMKSLLWDVKRQRPELTIKTGVFYSGIPNYNIRIDKKDPKTNLLQGIQIYDHTNRKGNTNVIIADSGYMKMTADEQNLLLILYNGYSYNELQENNRRIAKKTYPHRRDEFKEQRIVIELEGYGLQRTDESLWKSGYSMMNLRQLEKVQDSLRNELNAFHDKYSNNLIRGNYFRKRDYIRDIRKKNTEKRGIPGKPKSAGQSTNDTSSEIQSINLDIDSLYLSLSGADQSRIISQALSFARTTGSYVDNSNLNMDARIKRLIRHEIEWHRKFTLAFACFIFFFIGAPLGAIIRKGGLGMPVIISILFFILYYIITITTEKFAREDFISPFAGMWMASFILLPAGIFLTYKATTDSVILNMDTYLNFFKKIYGPKGKTISETEEISYSKQTTFPDTSIMTESLENLTNYSTNLKNRLRLGFLPGRLLSRKMNGEMQEDLRKFMDFYYSVYSGLSNSQYYQDDKYFKTYVKELPVLDPSEINLIFIPQLMKIILLTLLLPLGIFWFIVSLIKIRKLINKLTFINETATQLIKKVNI